MEDFKLIAFSIFSFVFFAISLINYKRKNNLKKNGIKAKAIVVDYFEETDRRIPTYYPIVEFTSADGVERNVKAIHGTNPKAYAINQEVNICYEENDIENLIIDSKTTDVISTIFLILSIILIIASGYFCLPEVLLQYHFLSSSSRFFCSV